MENEFAIQEMKVWFEIVHVKWKMYDDLISLF